MLIFILSLFSSFTYADGVFSKYYNGRFNYVINVPTTKYENGVGGTENLNFVKNSNLIPTKNLPKNIEPLKYDYNKTLFTHPNNVTYNTIRKNFYVISYIENNKVFYKKVIYSKDRGTYLVFEASYPIKDKKFMDSIVTEIAKSSKLVK